MSRVILSASRRTDIPAFYMPWFMQQIQQGGFEVENPYSGRLSRVEARVEQVHTIVFWSKDFGPFLAGHYGQDLNRLGYPLFFNFTLNSPHAVLEPGLPPFERRLAQLEQLCEHFGPQKVQWRFDPICFYATSTTPEADNLEKFAAIAHQAARVGVRVCITSFVDAYRKIRQRIAGRDLQLLEPRLTQKVAVINRMAQTLAPLGIALQLCCEKEVLSALPEATPIREGACIPGPYLAELNGADVSLARDKGQRAGAGCGCTVSKDIGSYRRHPCRHNCLYCYANPFIDQQPKPGNKTPHP